jgi:hypothetical protein
MKKVIFHLTCLVCAINGLFAQTEIGGIIKTNETFVKTKSPYIVTSDLVITQEGFLTLEPGVELRFNGGVKLEVRGKLIANGTVQDSITFTSAKDILDSINRWKGIELTSVTNSNFTFSYCRFLNSQNATHGSYGINRLININHSRFSNNIECISNISNDSISIENCLFSNNHCCIQSGTYYITGSIFYKNEIGIYRPWKIALFDSEFGNNQTAIDIQQGYIKDCKINNNEAGINAYFDGVDIQGCTITNNTIGLEIFGGSLFKGSVNNCKICSNKSYNVKYHYTSDLNLYTNCWCTTDSSAIENKIYDGFDDSNSGRINYSIYDESCSTIIKKVDKTSIGTKSHWVKTKSPYYITSDFIVYPNETLIIDPGVEVRFSPWTKLEIRGQLIANGLINDSITFTSKNAIVDSINSWVGLVFNLGDTLTPEISYCRFFNSSTAISSLNTVNKCSKILNSRFSNNNYGISNSYVDTLSIENCEFSNNRYGIANGIYKVENSRLYENENGIYRPLYIDIRGSEFIKNQLALYVGIGLIKDCKVINNETGITIYDDDIALLNNNISNNNVGIEIQSNIQFNGTIDNCKICSNKLFNLKYYNTPDLDLYNICWCSTDSSIIEGKIYDGFEDSYSGRINYSIYDESCSSIIKKVNKSVGKEIHWIKAKSPYYISSDYVVYPNETLIIDPGVEVRFSLWTKLEIRGQLVANGEVNDSITFTSLNTKTDSLNSWNGIVFNLRYATTPEISYCRFLNSSSAISSFNTINKGSKISNSRFSNNYRGISGNYIDTLTVENCEFSNNHYGIEFGIFRVVNSRFCENESAISGSSYIDVGGSEFINNKLALYAEHGLINDCKIVNNETGVIAFIDGVTLKKNNISNNNVGIEIHGRSLLKEPIDSCKICSNKSYNIKYYDKSDMDLYTNCWCSMDSSAIDDKIYDGYDYSYYGLVNFTVFSNNCDTPLFKTLKRLRTSIDIADRNSKNNLLFVIFPNPVSGHFTIKTNIVGNIKIEMYDISGRHIRSIKPESIVNISDLKAGVYILRTNLGNSQIVRKMCVE